MIRLIIFCIIACSFVDDARASSSYVEIGEIIRRARYLGVIQIDSGQRQLEVGDQRCAFKYMFHWINQLGGNERRHIESDLPLLIGGEYLLAAVGGEIYESSFGDLKNISKNYHDPLERRQCVRMDSKSISIAKHEIFEVVWLFNVPGSRGWQNGVKRKYWVSFGDGIYLYPTAFDVKRAEEFFKLVKLDPSVPSNSMYDFVPLDDVFEFIEQNRGRSE